MVSMINEGLLTTVEADEIKTLWETEHRIRMTFERF